MASPSLNSSVDRPLLAGCACWIRSRSVCWRPGHWRSVQVIEFRGGRSRPKKLEAESDVARRPSRSRN